MTSMVDFLWSSQCMPLHIRTDHSFCNMEGLFVSDAEIHEEAFTSFLPAMEFQDLSWPEDVEEIEREDPPLQPEQQQNHVLMIEEGIMPDWSVQLSNDYMPNVDLEYIAKMHIETVLPKLRSLLPANVIQSLGQPPSTLGARGIYNRFYDQLLFSAVSNNFAGLRDVPMTTILQYAKMNWRTKSVTKFMSCTSNPAAKNFTDSLLRCTIEARDTEMLELLLSGPFDLDVDQHIRSADGGTYSLIERAAILHDWKTMRMLLKRHANIHETNGVSNGGSILRYATQLDFPRDSTPPLDNDLIEELLRAGAEVTSSSIQNAIWRNDTALFERLAFTCPQHAKQCLQDGIFNDALEILHSEAVDRLMDFLLESGITHADLSTKPKYSYQLCFMETAAKIGNLGLIAKLHAYNVPLTRNTLRMAVQNENWNLVQALFQESMNIGLTLSDKDDDTLYGNALEQMWDAIGRAILAGHIEVENALLSDDARVAIHFGCQNAALELAIGKSDESEVERIVRSLEPAFDETRMDPAAAHDTHNRLLLQHLPDAIRLGQWHTLVTLLNALPHDCSWYETDQKWPIVEKSSPKDAGTIKFILDARLWPMQELSTLLAIAVGWCDNNIIEDLIVAGADVNGFHKLTTVDTDKYRHQQSMLSFAIQAGDLSIVHFLLSSGARVKDPDSRTCSNTLLTLAVKSRNIEMVRLLLAWGATVLDPRALAEGVETDNEIFAVLYESCSKYDSIILEPYITDALIAALDFGKIERYRQLLALIARSDQPKQRKHRLPRMLNSHSSLQTPLGAAIKLARPDRLMLVEMLLDAGYNPDEVVYVAPYPEYDDEPANQTALLAAIDNGEIKLVQTLLRHGANVDYPADRGVCYTPLQKAAQLGNMQICQLLINNGANLNASPAYYKGATALQLAAAGGYIGIAELLIQNGADVNGPIAKVHGKSAVEAATEHGRLHMVLFLLQQGAHLDLNQTSGQVKAIEYAKLNGHRGVVQLLESWVERVRSITNAGRQRLDKSTPEVHNHEQWNEKDTLTPTIDDLQDVDSPTPPSKGRTCRECNAGLSNPSALARHMKTVHKQSRANETAKFKCSSCNYSTNRKDTYRKHRATHTRE